jgi:hypothetical protein
VKSILPTARRLRTSVGFGLALAASACGRPDATADEMSALRALRGTLASARTSDAHPRGRYVEENVRLESSTGLVATGLLLHPANASGRCLPAMLLEDGREENSGVINRLPPEFGDMVVLSLDYPKELPDNPQIRDVTFHATSVRKGARMAPAMFSLGADYLAQRPDVDGARVAMVAASYAVPFGTIAAAMDGRIRNVALIYGAGSLPLVFAANLKGIPSLLRRPLASLAMLPFAPFTPERYVQRIAPRPLVMINGVDDPRMPIAAVNALYDAAREPKALILLKTGHLMPTDSSLIQSLTDTAMARLPVLRAGGRGECRGKGNALNGQRSPDSDQTKGLITDRRTGR